MKWLSFWLRFLMNDKRSVEWRETHGSRTLRPRSKTNNAWSKPRFSLRMCTQWCRVSLRFGVLKGLSLGRGIRPLSKKIEFLLLKMECSSAFSDTQCP